MVLIFSISHQNQVKHHLNKDIYELLIDGRQLILHNLSLIMRNPLEVYGSALAFAPQRKPLYRKYEHLLGDTVRVLRDVRYSDWSPFLWDSPHDSEITCVAYSSDESRIATGTEAGEINIWDGGSGFRKHSFHALEARKAIQSLKFLLDDTAIAGMVHLGEQIFIRETTDTSINSIDKILDHAGVINDFAICSGEGFAKLASASGDSYIRIWGRPFG